MKKRKRRYKCNLCKKVVTRISDKKRMKSMCDSSGYKMGTLTLYTSKKDTLIICPHCKKEAYVPAAYINRAKRLGVPRYCSKKCSGLARRKNYTPEQKKSIKSAYDKEYRKTIPEEKKFYKALMWGFDYFDNPKKYEDKRRKKMPKHIEYCRQPEYRKYKKEYDAKFTRQKKYGEFWEAAMALTKLKDALPTSKEIKYELGFINKTQKRKRKWQSKKPSSMLRI